MLGHCLPHELLSLGTRVSRRHDSSPDRQFGGTKVLKTLYR
jgi:hypothetical protein